MWSFVKNCVKQFSKIDIRVLKKLVLFVLLILMGEHEPSNLLQKNSCKIYLQCLLQIKYNYSKTLRTKNIYGTKNIVMLLIYR